MAAGRVPVMPRATAPRIPTDSIASATPLVVSGSGGMYWLSTTEVIPALAASMAARRVPATASSVVIASPTGKVSSDSQSQTARPSPRVLITDCAKWL